MDLEKLDMLVGGVPVSEQLAAALEQMAPREHTHNYATRDEINDLKKKIEMLLELVGDIPVSEQIYSALNNMK